MFAAGKGSEKKLLVWLVGEPSDDMPTDFLQHLLTLSSHALSQLVAPPPANGGGGGGGGEALPLQLRSGSLEDSLAASTSAVTAGFIFFTL